MANLLDLILGTKGGWNPDVPQTGVRPDYGLSTATNLGQLARSPYERTLGPGEQRTSEELQAMLAEVILAGGAGASPLTGLTGKQLARQQISAARVRPGAEKQFREWFGGSKAIDQSGKPLDLYHGTGTDVPITQFVKGKGFLTTSRERANSYAQTTRAALTGEGKELDGVVYPVHASVKRPFIVRTEGEVDMWRGPEGIKALRDQGYDGIMTVPNRFSGEQIVLPIESPSQIKSATGNRGTYSRESEDIRK